MIQVYGNDLLRYKGVLALQDNPHRVVFQGVHMLMGGDLGRPWGADEPRESVMVFIGRNLPKDVFLQGLEQCLVKPQ
jgi:G3E family GTPase